MRVASMFCAETVIVDASSGRISCINLIDDVAAPQFPLLLPQFSVLSLVRRDAGDADEHTAELTITLGDQTLAQGPVLINFQNLQSTRAILTINGFIVPQPGTLSVNLRSGELSLSEYSVVVASSEPQQINTQNNTTNG